MAFTERPKLGPAGNMSDWVNAIEEKTHAEAGEFIEGRASGLQGLRDLNLPHNETITVAPRTFFQNANAILDQVGTPRIYMALVPKDTDHPRYSYGGLYRNRAIEYVAEKIPKKDREYYDLAIQPYFENIYGGNIVIQPDGGLLVEFAKGKQAYVARGKTAPEDLKTITRDPYLGSLKFSFEDPKLRDILYDTLLAIPHTGTGRELKFTPGYYEFALVDKANNGTLEPLFLEYRNNAIYQTAPNVPLFDEGEMQPWSEETFSNNPEND